MHAMNELRRIGLANHRAESFSRAWENCKFDPISGSERKRNSLENVCCSCRRLSIHILPLKCLTEYIKSPN